MFLEEYKLLGVFYSYIMYRKSRETIAFSTPSIDGPIFFRKISFNLTAAIFSLFS